MNFSVVCVHRCVSAETSVPTCVSAKRLTQTKCGEGSSRRGKKYTTTNIIIMKNHLYAVYTFLASSSFHQRVKQTFSEISVKESHTDIHASPQKYATLPRKTPHFEITMQLNAKTHL